jgi:hypothetical protein
MNVVGLACATLLNKSFDSGLLAGSTIRNTSENREYLTIQCLVVLSICPSFSRISSHPTIFQKPAEELSAYSINAREAQFCNAAMKILFTLTIFFCMSIVASKPRPSFDRSQFRLVLASYDVPGDNPFVVRHVLP